MKPSFSCVGEGRGYVRHTSGKADENRFCMQMSVEVTESLKVIARQIVNVFKILRPELSTLSKSFEMFVIDSHSTSIVLKKCNEFCYELELRI